MPTGYTAAVVDGNVKDFPTFAMTCARAFGALIMMREDAMDAPIPEVQEPTTYHVKEREAAEQRLGRLLAMTPGAIAAQARADYAKSVKDKADSDARLEAEDRRCRKMAELVRAWTPPTPDHENMKTFMLDQLKISMHDFRMPVPQKRSPEVWHAEQLASARKDIEYHTKEDAEERARVAGRTAWVKALRDSLQPARV